MCRDRRPASAGPNVRPQAQMQHTRRQAQGSCKRALIFLGNYGSLSMQPLSDAEKVIYWFEEFELDPTRRLLLRQGQAVQLTPKVFETLLVLVRSRGRVMSKDELMQAV